MQLPNIFDSFVLEKISHGIETTKINRKNGLPIIPIIEEYARSENVPKRIFVIS